MAKALHFDCFSGASGDMILGALLDLGVPLDGLRAALGSLAIEYGDVSAGRVLRSGISATKFNVSGPGGQGGASAGGHVAHSHDHRHQAGDLQHHHPPPRDASGPRSGEAGPPPRDASGPRSGEAGPPPRDASGPRSGEAGPPPRDASGPRSGAAGPPAHDASGARSGEARHDHGHDAGHHHTLTEIAGLIDRSALSNTGKTRAKHLFRRLAEAEAAVHDMAVEQVHLHEVGAIDSIVDIVGAVYAFEWLGAAEITSSPMNVGSGTVKAAHGLLPVPAPATVRLLAGAPVYSGAVASELVTPTGALVVTDYATAFGSLPAMRIDRVGYGAGDRDFPGHPNVLRVFLGDTAGQAGAERIVTIECEIDDMNPQLFGTLMDRLYSAGALDVYYAAVMMKKSRPGVLVTVLALPDHREAIATVLFEETTTIGVRYQEMLRERLARETRTLNTLLGAVKFKVASRNGRVVNASPEFDDCARLALEHGLPVKDVQAIAFKAWLDQA